MSSDSSNNGRFSAVGRPRMTRASSTRAIADLWSTRRERERWLPKLRRNATVSYSPSTHIAELMDVVETLFYNSVRISTRTPNYIPCSILDATICPTQKYISLRYRLTRTWRIFYPSTGARLPLTRHPAFLGRSQFNCLFTLNVVLLHLSCTLPSAIVTPLRDGSPAIVSARNRLPSASSSAGTPLSMKPSFDSLRS